MYIIPIANVHDWITDTYDTKEIENCERSFLMTIVLSMVNTWLCLFSPYFRIFENDVLGYASETSTEDTRKEAEKEAKSKSEAKEESQCEAAEEAGFEAQEAIEEENGYKKEISRLKTRKEVSMMYSESTLVGC